MVFLAGLKLLEDVVAIENNLGEETEEDFVTLQGTLAMDGLSSHELSDVDKEVIQTALAQEFFDMSTANSQLTL